MKKKHLIWLVWFVICINVPWSTHALEGKLRELQPLPDQLYPIVAEVFYELARSDAKMLAPVLRAWKSMQDYSMPLKLLEHSNLTNEELILAKVEYLLLSQESYAACSLISQVYRQNTYLSQIKAYCSFLKKEYSLAQLITDAQGKDNQTARLLKGILSYVSSSGASAKRNISKMAVDKLPTSLDWANLSAIDWAIVNWKTGSYKGELLDVVGKLSLLNRFSLMKQYINANEFPDSLLETAFKAYQREYISLKQLRGIYNRKLIESVRKEYKEDEEDASSEFDSFYIDMANLYRKTSSYFAKGQVQLAMDELSAMWNMATTQKRYALILTLFSLYVELLEPQKEIPPRLREAFTMAIISTSEKSVEDSKLFGRWVAILTKPVREKMYWLNALAHHSGTVASWGSAPDVLMYHMMRGLGYQVTNYVRIARSMSDYGLWWMWHTLPKYQELDKIQKLHQRTLAALFLSKCEWSQRRWKFNWGTIPCLESLSYLNNNGTGKGMASGGYRSRIGKFLLFNYLRIEGPV